jgi:hypothetical protein
MMPEFVVWFLPTAVQFVLLGHATASRTLPPSLAFGVGSTVHVLPFHCSASVTTLSDADKSDPTAMQFVVLAHRTASSTSPVEPGASGLGNTVHVEPCNSATNVCDAGPKLKKLPTAKHTVADGHDTARKLADVDCNGLGVVCCDQALPSQCIATGVSPSLPCNIPTAMQLATPGQETPESASDGGAVPTFALGTIVHVFAALAGCVKAGVHVAAMTDAHATSAARARYRVLVHLSIGRVPN